MFYRHRASGKFPALHWDRMDDRPPRRRIDSDFEDRPRAAPPVVHRAIPNASRFFPRHSICEGLHRPALSIGDGIYKSTDAGKTWTHLGLRDGPQVTKLADDPRSPDRRVAAAAG